MFLILGPLFSDTVGFMLAQLSPVCFPFGKDVH